jgi:hypothetical protein
MAKLKKKYEEQSSAELRKIEMEMNLLLEEKKQWEDKKTLKEKKKTLESSLSDLLKASERNKEKLKVIQKIIMNEMYS